MYPSGMSRPDQHDPGTLLRGWWSQYTATSDDDMLSTQDRLAVTAPFGQRWPGLAPRPEDRAGPEATADQLGSDLLIDHPTMRLGLIAAERGADALTAAGWSGPANYTNDTAEISAVLRSWEDRFGVRVVLAGHATLYLSVAAPPTTPSEALQVAAEHFAFCPDNIWQGTKPYTLAAYAKRLIGEHSWAFGWD